MTHDQAMNHAIAAINRNPGYPPGTTRLEPRCESSAMTHWDDLTDKEMDALIEDFIDNSDIKTIVGEAFEAQTYRNPVRREKQANVMSYFCRELERIAEARQVSLRPNYDPSITEDRAD